MKTKLILTTLLLCINLVVKASDIPEGWQLVGSNVAGYTFGVDPDQGYPKPSGKLSSNDNVRPNEFGTSKQMFFPEEYLGKRVKLSAKIKSLDVKEWAGLWMRIDTEKKHGAMFDNMQNRAIVGSNEWHDYEIVLDVPVDSTRLSYGVLLTGEGQVWFDEFNFLVVDLSVPVTDMHARLAKKNPINNSF